MRIVVISPSAAERNALCELLAGDGHQVTTAATQPQGVDRVSLESPDVVIADAQFAGIDAQAWTRTLDELGVTARVILLCPRISRVFERDGVTCLTKPIELHELRRCLVQAPARRSQVA